MQTVARSAFAFSFKGVMYQADRPGAVVEMPAELAARIRDQGLVHLPEAGVQAAVPVQPAAADAAADLEPEGLVDSESTAEPEGEAESEPAVSTEAEPRPRRARKA